MERRVRWKSHARCEAGEKLEITSNSYLSISQTGEELKVLKIKDKIEDFKSFNMYLIKNEIAYYSKYAKGFVVKNIEKLQGVAATTTALYSPEVLEVFAKGTLF